MFNHSDSNSSGRPIRAALFDVDGTLVDTNDLHAAAWRETFARFGFDIGFDAIRWQIGKGGDNLIPTLLPDIEDARQEEMEDFRAELFKRDYLPRAVPFPGVRPLLERLYADGIRIVLASSAGAEEVDFHLNLIACSDLVAAATTKDDVASSKPCPDIFEAALAKVEPFGAEDTVVIGDSVWDVKAAAKLDLRTIGLRSGGFPDDALREAGAMAIYDGPGDLLARYERSPFAATADAEA